MALFDLNTAKGRFDFSTNKTLELAFQMAVIEISSEAIADAGDGTNFPYFDKLAYAKIKPFLLSTFKGGINTNRQVIFAFVATLPNVVVDEDELTTDLFDTLKEKSKTWIEYRQDVSADDKTTPVV